MTENFKYYLIPFGTVNSKNFKNLLKSKSVIKSGNAYFSFIKVVKRNKEKVSEKIFSIKEFFIWKKEKNSENLESLFYKLVRKRQKLKSLGFNSKSNYLISGILNVTPDSFSDGGDNIVISKSIKNAELMMNSGANFIDVGGESTRPGASIVDEHEECQRVLPIIQKLYNKNIKMSLDTRNSGTMQFGILSGVNIINDVSALKNDEKSIDVIKRHNVPVILMHMPGTPQNMMQNNKYDDVLYDVYDFLEERVNFCLENRIPRKNIIIDPGIGFGKNYDQNLRILQNLSIFHSLGCLIMLGISRKRFLTSVQEDDNPKDRLGGTIGTTIAAINQGVQIHRVHDVKQVAQAIRIHERIYS